MGTVKPRTMSGFMELLPERQMYFESILKTLRESYALYGFYPLDTPIIEASEILLAKGGGDTEKQIYRFNKGDNDLSLRFDLTVPLAKYVAMNYGKLTFPFRRYQIGKVYRGERPQKGRFREFYQADIDIVGDEALDIMCEAEVIGVIFESLTALGLSKFKIKINNRKILVGLFEMLQIGDKSAEVMRTIDKIDKVGKDKLKTLLCELELSEDVAQNLIDFVSHSGSNSEKIDFLKTFKNQTEVFKNGVAELETVVEYAEHFGVSQGYLEVDFSIARGLDYYTGTIYETVLTDFPQFGSVCSGGRYDDLASYYTDKKLPGVGLSIGVTRLFSALEEYNLLNEQMSTSPCDVLIIPMIEELSPCLLLATKLREQGIRTQVFSGDKKFKQKMSYANKIGAPYVAILGEDELVEGAVAIKNMQSGEQVKVLQSQAAEFLKNAILNFSKTPIHDI